jgi:hypothetical protein
MSFGYFERKYSNNKGKLALLKELQVDVKCLTQVFSASKEDIDNILKRKDSLISDPNLKNLVQKNAFDLSNLPEKVNEKIKEVDGLSPLSKLVSSSWISSDKKAASNLQNLQHYLEKKVKQMEEEEGEKEGYSSYSDYSESETSSSSSSSHTNRKNEKSSESSDESDDE